MFRFVLILAALLTLVFSFAAKADQPSDKLIAALIQHESSGDDSKVGDLKLKNKAYGCLQIRKPCIDDFNAANGTKHWPQDCLGKRELSIQICRWYINHYANEKRLGHVPTDQDKARIWNGGPDGYDKESTLGYWREVEEILSATK